MLTVWYMFRLRMMPMMWHSAHRNDANHGVPPSQSNDPVQTVLRVALHMGIFNIDVVTKKMYTLYVIRYKYIQRRFCAFLRPLYSTQTTPHTPRSRPQPVVDRRNDDRRCVPYTDYVAIFFNTSEAVKTHGCARWLFAVQYASATDVSAVKDGCCTMVVS